MRCTVALALILAAVGCNSKNHTDDMGVGGNGTDDMGPPPCGNGVVDPNEDCDDGVANGTVGDPCNANCQFTCAVDANCDDGKACNGAETCVGHICKQGTPLDDGTSCGSAMLCRAGVCVASRCGDKIVTAPEECDDGNVTDGDGCDSNCKFSCKSSDPARNCTPTDACAGQGTCNDTTHVCAAGTPLTDGTMCGTGNDYCKTGHCTMPMCGNGVKEPGEDCDDGGLNGTLHDGCTTACKFACVNPATDCGAPPVCEKFQCTTAHVCQAVPDASQNGNMCGSMLVCKDGACAGATAVCGNGIVETGEDCDFGTGNGPNTGCEANTCKFSCANAAACDDGNACNGTETCDPVTVGSSTGKKCDPGTALSDGTACGTTKICVSKICQNSTCGDGVIDIRTENCDPPGSIVMGKTCDTHCHLIVCGDGKLEDTEQCDDSNLVNLDGCDSNCKFEQEQRANFLDMSFDTTICNPNRLGGAIQSVAQSSISSSLATNVKNGMLNIMMKFVGLDDLTGTSSTAPFALGFVNSSVVSGTGYDGTMDLDWWYTVDTASIDGNRNPKTSLMNGKFAGSTLSADKGTVVLNVVIAGSPAVLTMYDSVISAQTVDAANAPTISSAGGTPGHLTTENILPSLKSFPTLSNGHLCGNITAASLAAVVMPSSLTGLTCFEGYTASDHLLDAIVNGCTTFLGTAINKTQPDGSIDGNHYTITLTGGRVKGCTGGAAYPTCLDKATFSSGFKFTSDRVIAK
jgi:cysteine-rich repeat protein